MSSTGGMIYAVGAEGIPYVKIGCTRADGTAMKHRLRALQTGHPFPLSIRASVAVGQAVRAIEKAIHRHLATHHVHGEWFAIDINQGALEKLVMVAIQECPTALHRLPSSTSDLPTLGQTIQQARIAQRLKQKDLVERTNLSQKYLSQIENDRVDPHFGVVQTIARALHISLDALALEQIDKPPKEQMDQDVPDGA